MSRTLTYGGASVLHQPLRLGNAPLNSSLGVVVGRDGAVISAQVNDSDGKPLIDAYVYALPAAAARRSGAGGDDGVGPDRPPGTVRHRHAAAGQVLRAGAAQRGGRLSAFGVGRLWTARLSQGTEVELGHGGFRQVRLAPVEIR